jgi:hypothetical protein
MSPIVRLGLWFLAFMLLVGAVVSGYFLTRLTLEARATADWPSVPGMVTKAEVAATSVGRFYARVGYTYRVGEKDYTGSKLGGADGEYQMRDGAVQALRGLTVGETTPVYYNPSNPRQAVLKPGAGYQEYAMLIAPVFMLAIGVAACIILRRTRAQTPTPASS